MGEKYPENFAVKFEGTDGFSSPPKEGMLRTFSP
jgi:hypothetical protein